VTGGKAIHAKPKRQSKRFFGRKFIFGKVNLILTVAKV
jgi:hypothetical protein